MPVYNGSTTQLRRAVESVRAQTYRGPLEIVLVDDGSSDESVRSAIDELRSSVVRVIRLPENRGIVAALNEAINHSTGEVILCKSYERLNDVCVNRFSHVKLLARMDADDLCETTRLETQVAFLANNPSEQRRMVISILLLITCRFF